MNLLSALKQRRQQRTVSEREQYLALIRKPALNPADIEKLDALVQSLGLSEERVEADLAAVARWQELRAQRFDIDALRKQSDASSAAFIAHVDETQRIKDARAAEERRLRIAAENDEGALQEALKHQGELADHERQFSELLTGRQAEAPKKPIAHLLPHLTDVEQKFLHAENNHRSKDPRNDDPDKLTELREQRERAVEAHRKLTESAIGQVFNPLEKDLDSFAVTAIGFDPDDYDWRPIKGQDADQFNFLLKRVREACQRRDAAEAISLTKGD